ncbi:MAG TPA: hypothetical protein PKK56_00170 [archaeon]|nr:hypothetical protein [archaeon]HRT02434.1 hypothetical protein [Candidatus Diapherotrites archaeon]
MKHKLLFGLIICFFILTINKTYSLEMLEPITQDLTNIDTLDLGYASPGEYFLVSFLVNKEEGYDTITIDPTQQNEISIQNQGKTKESIFATIEVSDKLSGAYTIKIILTGENKQKQLNLNVNITNNVIYSVLEPYNTYTKYNETKTFSFKIINKSISTKKIIVSSDLPEYWFNDKNVKKYKYYTLQPNSVTDITYEINPKEIGKTNFSIYIFTKYFNKENRYDTTNKENIIIYDVQIETEKTITGEYGTNNFYYPLFNVNTLPIYFFNKILAHI